MAIVYSLSKNETPEQREARIERVAAEMRKRDEEKKKLLLFYKEICTDATGKYKGRVTDWEYTFCAETLARIELYNMATRISEKQEAVLKKIEEKIYAT